MKIIVPDKSLNRSIRVKLVLIAKWFLLSEVAALVNLDEKQLPLEVHINVNSPRTADLE